MKKSLTKRLVSAFLAVMMLVTSLPLVSITAFAGYNSNYSETGYYSKYDLSSNLVARFNFDSSLDGVTGAGSTSGAGTTIAAGTTSGVTHYEISNGRKGVASIPTATSVPYSYANMISNPLAKSTNQDEMSVTFWHFALHDKEVSNNKYAPVVTFYNPSKPTQYVCFTQGGYMLYSDGAVAGSGVYVDYLTESSTDIVGHSVNRGDGAIEYAITASSNATWVHYGFSLTKDTIAVYVSGVKYEISGKTTGDATDANGATVDYSDNAIFTKVLNFIHSSTTTMAVGYMPFENDMYGGYVDDIRLYNKALNQLEIRSLFGENDTNSIYSYAQGHDPTIIYNRNYGKPGFEGEYAYYQFGTGMCIFGSNDMSNWYEIGDSQGRTGYQNQEYWGTDTNTGADYKTVLTAPTTNGNCAPLTWSSESNGYSRVEDYGSGNGAMVWAPSVYYNETTQKYMMVSSTSSWGSWASCIFAAESDSIEGPYFNITPIMYSGFNDDGGDNDSAHAGNAGVSAKLIAAGVTTDGDYHQKYLDRKFGITTGYTYWFKENEYPNCIDACPFYAKNGELYMALGSWGAGIWMVKLTDDGLATDSKWMYDNGFDPYYGKQVAVPTNEQEGKDGQSDVVGSIEGSYCFYNPDTGTTYMNVTYGYPHGLYYTMRVFGSRDDCPMAGTFRDALATTSTTTITDSAPAGMKLIGNYSFYGSDYQYYSNGHCSYTTVPDDFGTNEAGKTFISYHTRLYDAVKTERAYGSTNMMNESREHQVLFNAANGYSQCVVPYQYSGETFDQTTPLVSELPGMYATMDHGDYVVGEFVKTVRYAFYLNEGQTNNGYVLDESSNKVANWDMTDDNYLYIRTTDNSLILYSCMVLKTIDEKGKERLVFTGNGHINRQSSNSSALVGTTGVETNQFWGVKLGNIVEGEAFSNPDASLFINSMMYTQGAYDSYGTAGEFYYGTEIASDEGYESLNNYTEYKCKLYVKSGWSIDSISSEQGGTYSPVDYGTTTYNGETYHVYYIIGNVPEDPNTSTGYDLKLRVNYHNDNNSEVMYSEDVYTWVVSTPTEAHTVSASYFARKIFSTSNQRSAAFAMKLENSYGMVLGTSTTTTSGSDYNVGVGCYRSVDLLNERIGWTQQSEVNNSDKNATYSTIVDAPKSTGTYAYNYYTSSSNTARNASVADSGKTATGYYYIDMSNPSKPDSITIDDSGNWTITAQVTGVPNYFGCDETQYMESITVSGGSGVTWDATACGTGSGYKLQNYIGSTGTDATQQFLSAVVTPGQSQPSSKIYDSKLRGNGTQKDITLSARMTHETSTPMASATCILKANVFVYDKSITRDALVAATELDLTSNEFYTQETWNNYNEAIRVANAFVNNSMNAPTNASDWDFSEQDITVVSNGSTYVISTNGVTKDGVTLFDGTAASSQEMFAAWINYVYDSLFPQSLYLDVCEVYDEAESLHLAGSASYTQSSYAEFESIYNAVYENYTAFSENALVTEEETENGISSWRDIADTGENADNYQPINADASAKQNYQEAKYNLQVAIAKLRKHAVYDGLVSELNSAANTTAQTNQLYTDDNTDNSYQIKNETQHYTVNSWAPYASAYSTADETNDNSSLEHLYYQSLPVTITNEATGASTTINSDDTANKSDIQIKIEVDTTNLNTAVNKLVKPASDYNAYDYSVELLDAQDMAAFTEEFINSANSPYSVVKTQGSNGVSVTFDTGDNIDVTCNTGVFGSTGYGEYQESAYVVYNNQVFYNAGQATLDNATSSILQNLNDANESTDNTVRTDYTVTFKVVVDGVEKSSSTNTYFYGDVIELDASSAVGDATCNSWEVTNGTTRRFVNRANTFTLNVQADTTVVAYATAGATESAPIQISVLNQYNQPFHNIAVTADTTIVLNSNSVTIGGGSSMTIPTMPNYTITGWKASGSSKAIELGKEYKISDFYTDQEVLAFYPSVSKADKNTYTITLDGSTVATGAYDNSVTVTSAVSGVEAIAVLVDGKYYVASYGNEYTFYINRNMDFVSIVTDGNGNYFVGSTSGTQITDPVTLNKLEGKLPFVYSMLTQTGANGNGTPKYTTFSTASRNCSIQITEFGTLYSKTASTDDTLVLGGSNVYCNVASNPSNLTGQFSYTIPTKGNLYTRGYVKYIVTFNDGLTMQCIEYGNICTK